MERPVTFTNKRGQKLFGVIHEPERPLRLGARIGVNLLNPGIKYRVAPNRLNVKLARELCNNGYYVLRFDPEGIGDSEGELPAGLSVIEVFGKIQSGLFVDDTQMANRYLRDEFGIDDLILIGNCGGAITALAAAAEDSGVDALCLIDVPVHLSNALRAMGDNDDVINPAAFDYRRLLETYLKELRHPATWHKLLTQKTAYRKVWSFIMMKLRGRRDINKPLSSGMNLDSFCREYQLNPMFYRSVDAVLQKRVPIFFIASQYGPGRATFDKFYLQSYWERHPERTKFEEVCSFISIEKANHVLSLTESQDALYENINRWITKNYPVRFVA